MPLRKLWNRARDINCLNIAIWGRLSLRRRVFFRGAESIIECIKALSSLSLKTFSLGGSPWMSVINIKRVKFQLDY